MFTLNARSKEASADRDGVVIFHRRFLIVKARDMMRTANVQTVQSNDTLADAARKMMEGNVSALPVLDKDRRVVGMISERDLATKCEQESKTECLKNLQTPMAWLTSESGTTDAGGLMKSLSALGRTNVGEVMTSKVVTMNEDDSVGAMLQQMAERNVNHVPVVSSGGRLTGIVARQDVISALSSLAKAKPEAF